jgi:molecular chaperone GrpE
VLQVMQAGYELMGRIVRPALVVVAAKGGSYANAGGDAGGSVDTKA